MPQDDEIPVAASHSADTCEVYPGCVIGLAVLRGRIGLDNGWQWVGSSDVSCSNHHRLTEHA